MKFLQGILLACSMLMFIACSSDDAPKPDPAHRTVLVYIGAENSLYSYVSDDLDEMIQGAGDIPASDNLLVYVDDRSTPRIYKIGIPSLYIHTLELLLITSSLSINSNNSKLFIR